MDLDSWKCVLKSVLNQIVQNLLYALFVNLSLFWDVIIYMVLETKTLESCDLRVVLTDF